MDMCCFVVDGVEMRGQVLNQNGILVFLMNPVFKVCLTSSHFDSHTTKLCSLTVFLPQSLRVLTRW